MPPFGEHLHARCRAPRVEARERARVIRGTVVAYVCAARVFGGDYSSYHLRARLVEMGRGLGVK
jgi:hypothetical protein